MKWIPDNISLPYLPNEVGETHKWTSLVNDKGRGGEHGHCIATMFFLFPKYFWFRFPACNNYRAEIVYNEMGNMLPLFRGVDKFDKEM